MAEIIDIADAVVAALNGHTFGQPFTAERLYAPHFDLKDMKDLHVTVVPRSMELATAGRGIAQDDLRIDVAVQKKLAPSTGSGQAADNAEIDELMGLVEEIADFIRSTGRFGEAVWLKTENAPIYSPEHLDELRQFTSVLTVSLRVMKP